MKKLKFNSKLNLNKSTIANLDNVNGGANKGPGTQYVTCTTCNQTCPETCYQTCQNTCPNTCKPTCMTTSYPQWGGHDACMC